MKNIISSPSVCLAALLLFGACSAGKKATTASSAKNVESWYAKKDWAAGLKLVPYAGISKKEFYTQYHKHPDWWNAMFAYMRDHDLAALPVGKSKILGDTVTLSVTEMVDRDFDKTNWESHRRNIDMQYIARGSERMLVADTTRLTVIKPYDPQRDVANYTGEGTSYTGQPGTFFLFFPADAHRPNIRVNDSLVKKVVIKIRYAD